MDYTPALVPIWGIKPGSRMLCNSATGGEMPPAEGVVIINKAVPIWWSAVLQRKETVVSCQQAMPIVAGVAMHWLSRSDRYPPPPKKKRSDRYGRDTYSIHYPVLPGLKEYVLTFVVVQLISFVQLFVTHGPQHARLPSLWLSRSLLRFMFVQLVMLSNYLILCCFLLLCPQSFPTSRSFPVSQLFASGGSQWYHLALLLPLRRVTYSFPF